MSDGFPRTVDRDVQRRARRRCHDGSSCEQPAERLPWAQPLVRACSGRALCTLQLPTILYRSREARRPLAAPSMCMGRHRTAASITRSSAAVRRRFLPSSHSRSVGPVWTIGSTSTTRQTDLRESTYGIRRRWTGPPRWGISITSPLRCLHRRVNSPSSGPSGTDRSIRTRNAAPHSRCDATVPGGASWGAPRNPGQVDRRISATGGSRRTQSAAIMRF
jgi:hypothetical protein